MPLNKLSFKVFHIRGQNQSRRNQCLKVSGKYFSEQKVSYNFRRSYTTSSRIGRSNLFDKKTLGKQTTKREKGLPTLPNRPNHPKKAKARTVPTSSPYGELGLSRPARLMGSSDCPDQLAIWRARTVPTSSPYGELRLSRPADITQIILKRDLLSQIIG